MRKGGREEKYVIVCVCVVVRRTTAVINSEISQRIVSIRPNSKKVEREQKGFQDAAR